MIACNGFLSIFDTHPSAGLNVLNMEEPKHGIEIRLEDFDFFTTRRRRIGSLCNNIDIVVQEHRGIHKFVQEHASKSAEKADGGNIDLKEGIEGLSGESVEDFLGNACECQVSKGEALSGELITNVFLNGAGRGGCFFFRESHVHCRPKSSDIASKGLTRFRGTEQMDDKLSLRPRGRGLLILTTSLNFIILVGMGIV